MGAEQRQIPARTCVLCRNRRQKDVLFRIVRTPEGDIVFDIKEVKKANKNTN